MNLQMSRPRARTSVAAGLLISIAMATGCTKGGDVAQSESPAVTGPLRFGVLPAVDVAKTTEIYAPLVKALSTAIGREVTLHVADNYEALLADMLTGKAQLAQVSSYLFVRAAMLRKRAKQPFDIIAQERRPADSPNVGVFVVKPDSPITKVAELKDKKMAYVAKSSSSGFYYPRMKVRALGYDPDELFAEVSFAGSHDAVLKAVKSGAADVGAVSELSATLSGLRVIERTDSIPNDAVISLGGLSGAEVQMLRAFYLGAHSQPALANFFIARGIEKYVAAEIEIYAPQEAEMDRTEGTTE